MSKAKTQERTKKPYADLSDFQKIRKQWHKLSGLHTREEWSAAVVRAATAAEIAANVLIRKEFADRSEFDAAMVDSLLKWANGLEGKVAKLIKPLLAGREDDLAIVKKHHKAMEAVSLKRNMIVHGGEFCGEKAAKHHIASCKAFVEGIVSIGYEGFELHELELEDAA